MADEKTEEKTKRTVPPLVRTAQGVAAHAADVLAMQWDKEKKVFRDPFTVMLSLFTYAKLTAALLHEAEERSDKRREALEKRVAEFETRLTTMENWKDAAEAQTAVMMKEAEEMMKRGPDGLIEQLNALKGGGNVVSLPSAPGPIDAVVVEETKPPHTKKQDKKNGS